MSLPACAEIDAAPFDLEPEASMANGAAALCLHGLTGTPYEVRPMAEALVARGIRALGPLGAGHDGGPMVLAATPYEAWVEKARAEFDALRRDHERVFLVGVSMGGLLSLRLAETMPVDALVVLGTPLALRPPIPQLLPIMRLFRRFRRKGPPGIEDPAARERHPGLYLMPLDAVAELIQLQAVVIDDLGSITAPILVAHGKHDRTARPRDAEKINRMVGSTEKEVVILERSGHVASVDYDGPSFAQATAAFLSRRCGR